MCIGSVTHLGRHRHLGSHSKSFPLWSRARVQSCVYYHRFVSALLLTAGFLTSAVKFVSY